MLTLEVQGIRLEFEHSLVALSKWEAKYEKPFFAWTNDDKDKRTHEEMLEYFRFMLVNPPLDSDLLIRLLNPSQHIELVEYINSPQTATIVREIASKPGPRENVTTELMYYWMVAFKIPFQPTETWHINRLMTLVRVCSAKQAPPEKMDSKTAAQQMRELNEQRKRELNTKG